MSNRTEIDIARKGRKFAAKQGSVVIQYPDNPKAPFLSCELSKEQIASRIANLMGNGVSANQILLQYAEGLDNAADKDDLSLVRTGRDAEQFEIEFRQFVAEFPGAAGVTSPEGELVGTGVALARMEPKLRRTILRRWAEIIRTRASNGST